MWTDFKLHLACFILTNASLLITNIVASMRWLVRFSVVVRIHQVVRIRDIDNVFSIPGLVGMERCRMTTK